MKELCGAEFLLSDYVREIVRKHNAGENHDERLWFLVNFEIWQRRFIDGEAIVNKKVEFEETVSI